MAILLIESITAIIEILLQILGRYPVICFQQKYLEVADGDRRPGQSLSGFVGWGYPSGMVLRLADLHQ